MVENVRPLPIFLWYSVRKKILEKVTLGTDRLVVHPCQNYIWIASQSPSLRFKTASKRVEPFAKLWKQKFRKGYIENILRTTLLGSLRELCSTEIINFEHKKFILDFEEKSVFWVGHVPYSKIKVGAHEYRKYQESLRLHFITN